MDNKKNFIFRIFELIFGTCCISIGIAFLSKANIGMSPLSSFPYVLSMCIPKLSLGTWILLWNVLFVILQIPLEGKNYKLYLLLQIPLAFLLGYVTDFAKYIISPMVVEKYLYRFILTIIGIIITGFGVTLTVRAKLVMNGPEAFLHSLAKKVPIKFGTLKSTFDILNVILAIIVSLIIFHRVDGVREGTILAAILVGYVVNICNLIFSKHSKQ